MNTMKRLTSAILLSAATVSPLRADEFTSWEWLVPKPAGIFLSKVVFDGTRFVGVGDMGIILSSTNGTNWHLGFTETTNRMFGIMAGGGRLVASGAFGTLLVSTNADHWVQPPTAFGVRSTRWPTDWSATS